MGTASRDFKRDDRQDPAHRQFCRLCACEVSENDAVDVFGDEGRRYYLQTKIRKYLYILVTSEDILSKMVCSTCIKRLEGVHRFAMMAYRTQERLKVQLHENMDNINSFEEGGTDDSKDGQDNVKKVEDRGLLHSILTKGAIEILTEGEPLGSTEILSEEDKTHSSSMEEMEVKVDPMLFLQCGMDHSSSEISDVSDSEETRSRIRSPEWSPLMDKDTEKKKDEVRNSDDIKKSHEEVNESISNSATKPYECTICNRSFVSQIGLQNHLWSHLPKEKKLDGKPVLRSHQVYSSNGVLHTNGDNNSSGNFICPICSKKISV